MNRAYTVAVRHARGERGCVFAAYDRQDAHIKGLDRVALRPDEVPASGAELHVTDLEAKS